MQTFKNHIIKHSVNIFGYAYKLGLFVVIVAIFFFFYRILVGQVLDGSNRIVPIFILWVFTAYITLPRIHRFLTKRYLPNYYVGRVRSGSGLLADPINLVFFGREKDIHASFESAKWTIADPLTISTVARAAYATLLNRKYVNAPVGNMYLFGRKQDFAYQLQVGNSPKVRHHIRFWEVPKNWRLPGGHKAQWLAAATYDRSVGIKLFTLQIDHMIATNIDEERDYIIDSLKDANAIESMEVIKHFTDAYHDHNNGGDTINTDGSLPFITLHKF